MKVAGWTRPVGGMAAALLVLLLFGCGSGSSGEPSGGAEAPPSGSAAHESPGSGEASSAQGASNGASRAAHPKPSYEGAEEEVERLGSEAEGSEREAVLGAEEEYLTALSEQNFANVCQLLAKSTRMQLQQLVQGRKVGCATILPRLLGSPAASTARAYLQGEVRGVRLSGNKAFVIFHAPGARLFMIGLGREAGRWHVGSLTASVLAPSKAALGG